METPDEGVRPAKHIRSDNNLEFVAKKLQRWLAEGKIKTIHIDLASPWQNGFVESFHGRFRDECLNREQLWTLTEARFVIEGRLSENARAAFVSGM
jgi:transposase InsO family protein